MYVWMNFVHRQRNRLPWLTSWWGISQCLGKKYKWTMPFFNFAAKLISRIWNNVLSTANFIYVTCVQMNVAGRTAMFCALVASVLVGGVSTAGRQKRFLYFNHETDMTVGLLVGVPISVTLPSLLAGYSWGRSLQVEIQTNEYAHRCNLYRNLLYTFIIALFFIAFFCATLHCFSRILFN